MATKFPYERHELEGIETLKNYLSNIRPRPPDDEIPEQVEEWLTALGWTKTITSDEITLFAHINNFPGLYMRWYEAVSCEFMRFLTIGNVGRKNAQDQASV